MLKKVLLVTNKMKDPDGVERDKIISLLKERNITYTAICGQEEPKEEDYDCAIILGGDGTILRMARKLSPSTPILGVNMGTIGFLAEVETNQVAEALDKMITGEATLLNRMMIDGEVSCNDGIKEIPPALNDICIIRNGKLQIVSFEIYVGGQFLCALEADGIIVATPTGSTGYNISAGGSVVNPAANMILLTPICSHNLSIPSIILDEKDELSVLINGARDGKDVNLDVFVDALESIPVRSGDRIVLHRSSRNCSTVKLSDTSFVQSLQRKLK